MNHQLFDFEKMHYLQTLFSKTAEFHQLWVTWDATREAYIKIILKKSEEYQSNVFPEIVNKPEFQHQHQSYYYFNCYGSDTPEAILLLQLRISENGKTGELVWLRSEANLSGENLMSFYHLLSQYLQIEKTFLLDASEYKKSLIRITRPLVDPDGKSWYTKHGFELFDCRMLPSLEDGVFFQQESCVYQDSIGILKETPCEVLLNACENPRDKAFLKEVQQQYLPGFIQHSLTASLSNTSPSVGALAKAMYTRMRKDIDTTHKIRKGRPHQHAFQLFYKKFLAPQHTAFKKPNSANPRSKKKGLHHLKSTAFLAFEASLDVLSRYQVFCCYRRK